VNAFSAPRVVGLLVGLYGAITTARWLSQAEALTRLIPDSQHLGIVNPLLFVAIGICFFGASQQRHPRVWLARASAVCIAALIALPLGYLFEAATGIALGIDIIRAGTAATAASPNPGRLSPNASLAFLLTGIAFWVLRRPPTRVRRLVFLTLVLAVAALGLAALVGYLVGLETLYQLANFNRMLPATAVALSVVGAGLWMLYDASPAFDGKDLLSSERRIKWRSIAVITLVALAGGVAGFAVMRDTFERSVSKDMQLTATTNATSLAHALDVSLWLSRTVASRPAMRQALAKLGNAPDDAAAKDFLQTVADSFLTADVTGVEFYDAGGRLVVKSGSMLRPQAKVVQRLLNAGQTASLAWKDGYALLADNDVVVDGHVVGRVLTDQRMPLFDRLLADLRASSETSDVAICGREAQQAICAPNRFRPAGFATPMFDAAGNPGLPVTRALRGERGVLFIKDGRGTSVVSAYAPIKDFGLGFAVRTDVETLYAPLRSRLNLLALSLFGIVAVAIYAVHSQVRPLLTQLVASEQRVKSILEDQSELVSLAKPDGELTYVNPAYARHFGLTPASMIGANLLDHVEPVDREIVRHVIADVLATGSTITGENRMKAANGVQRWVAWTNTLQRDPSGQPMLHSVGRDVTERKQAELALRASQEQLTEKSTILEATLQRMEQGVMMVNAQRVVEVCNRRAIELLDLPKDLMVSKPTFEQVLAYQWSTNEFVHTPQDVQEFVRQGGILDRPHCYDRKRPDGRVIEVHSVPIEGGGVLRTYTDVTERRRAEERIRHVARHDGLTSLVNREVFLEHLAGAVETSERTGEAFAVHYIDLDGFKPINDRCGHAVGDKVLALVASRMRQIARDTDVVARMGGDEFAILQHQTARADAAQGLALRILEGVGQTMEIESHRLQVGASIGIALYPAAGADADALVRSADVAMYAAKASGRDCVRVFSAEGEPATAQ
jgi:diguanylate cyclase (GGDEF)-like protein/PAS domain S-box-containing protein